jgi:hypothetical protein
MAISFIGKVSNGKTIEVYPNAIFFEGIGSALTFIFGLIAVFIATRALGAKSEGPRCFEIVVGIVKFAVIIGAVLGRIIIQSSTSGSLSVEPSATQAEVSSGASSAFESGSVVSPYGTGHLDVFAKQGSMKDVGKNLVRFGMFTELGWANDRRWCPPWPRAWRSTEGSSAISTRISDVSVQTLRRKPRWGRRRRSPDVLRGGLSSALR